MIEEKHGCALGTEVAACALIPSIMNRNLLLRFSALCVEMPGQVGRCL